MKLTLYTKIFLLLVLVGFSIFIGIIHFNYMFNMGSINTRKIYSHDFNEDYQGLRYSKISGYMHIIGSVGWNFCKDAGKCSGSGLPFDPYVIKDYVIDGEDSYSCIWIENSNVYFRIENCTVFNSGYSTSSAGIRLKNVSNGLIIENNCSENPNTGILLENSHAVVISANIITENAFGLTLKNSNNNTIDGNLEVDNHRWGIEINHGYNNSISGNIIKDSATGIYLYQSISLNLSGNLMSRCGLRIDWVSLEEINTHEIDTTNLVNGKYLYYYTNSNHLTPIDFTNAGQILLYNCSNSLISNINCSYSTRGISLYFSNNNTLFKNTVNNNNFDGIRLEYSDNNNISKNKITNNQNAGVFLYRSNNSLIANNILYRNNMCIYEYDSEGNIYINNSCFYIVPGYNIFFIIAIITGIVIILMRKLKKS